MNARITGLTAEYGVLSIETDNDAIDLNVSLLAADRLLALELEEATNASND